MRHPRHALLVLIFAALPALAQQTLLWGTPVNGLRIGLSQDTSGKPPSQTPALRLSLHNVGTKDVTVILGAGCAQFGQLFQSPNYVQLILTDSSGTSKRLVSLADSSCAGLVSIFYQTLRPGAMFSTPIMLGDYWTAVRDNHGFWQPQTPLERGWRPGVTYTLEADISHQPSQTPPLPASATSGPFFWWVGTVTSNQLKVHTPAL